MTIKRIAVANLRNLRSVEVDLDDRINLFVGANGSGKTSLLEGVYLLSTGRSFRARSAVQMVSSGEEELTVFGEAFDSSGAGSSCGIQRGVDGWKKLQVNGQAASRSSELAERLPVQLINTDTIALLAGPPSLRRRFINWGLFHVEPRFHGSWMAFQNALRQRNVLLRDDKIDESQLRYWSSAVGREGHRVNEFVDGYISRLQPLFLSLASRFSDIGPLELEYHPGWPGNQEYEDAVENNLASDRRRGFTQVGPHRADMVVRTTNAISDSSQGEYRPAKAPNVADRFSRGELKLVACCLMLAQVVQLAQVDKECTVLVDDLASELDAAHQRQVCGVLDSFGAQVLVTATDDAELHHGWAEGIYSLFHVEQGQITQG